MPILDEDSMGIIAKFMSRGLKAEFKLIEVEKHKELVKETLREKDVEIYVHYPFCRSICQLCPYFRSIYREDFHEKYMKALIREVEEYRKLIDFNILGVHIGGGTPSLMRPEDFKVLMNLLDNPKDAVLKRILTI